MRRQRSCSIIFLAAPLAYLCLTATASAGTITAQGNVTALDDLAQLPSITGSALFDEETQGMIPLDQYTAAGMTFVIGELPTLLPGVMEMGEVPDPAYTGPGVHFPHPIVGNGVQQGSIIMSGGAMTFSDPITQFGLTAGGSGFVHITAWDQAGAIIGQVSWEPEEGDAAFVGIDTMGVPIALLTVGNDDIMGGEPYDVQGPAARSDSWVWGVAAPCAGETDCLDDTWACTAHACTEGACAYSYTTEPCDDADMCTEMDTCDEGECIGSTVSCSDAEICTFDTCSPTDGCSSAPIEGCCHTDEDCVDDEECLLSANTCVPGPPPPPMDGSLDDDDDGGEDTDTGGETTGGATEDGGGGCGCTTDERGSTALFGLFGLLGLVLLVGAGRRREA